MAEQVIRVNDAAFPYLAAQRGRLEPLAGERKKFCEAYRSSIEDDFRSIEPHLPSFEGNRNRFVLDVGSGLGGIDILIHAHYLPQFAMLPILMDGAKDQPKMTFHRVTFNDMDVANSFHMMNGNPPISYIDVNAPQLVWPVEAKADLVISIASWCFHYSPETYLDFVLQNSSAEATFILDVRRGKLSWLVDIYQHFHVKAVLPMSDKINRLVLARQNDSQNRNS